MTFDHEIRFADQLEKRNLISFCLHMHTFCSYLICLECFSVIWIIKINFIQLEMGFLCVTPYSEPDKGKLFRDISNFFVKFKPCDYVCLVE